MSYMVSDPQEEALSRLLAWINGVDLPMFVLRKVSDTRLEYVYANDALGRVADMSNAAFTGQSAGELFSARTAAQLEENYWKCLNSDTPVSYEECVVIDGRETWWQTTLSKPVGFNGRIALGIAVSITERKQREFSNASALADLNARFEELKLFSTMAAHDARSPLATVSSLIDLIRDGFEDMGDGKVELLKLCSKTVDEALEQITSTLERGRNLETTGPVGNVVEMPRLCGDIAAMIDPEMKLDIEVPDATIDCDEVVLQMSIRNLMSNAARFCEKRIRVSVTANEKAGMLQIDVADDGDGVPVGTSVDDLTARAEARDDGHGFGLRSISNLLRGQAGSLTLVASDDPGKLPGACFRIVLAGKIVSLGFPRHRMTSLQQPELH